MPIDPQSGRMLIFNKNPWRRLSAFQCGTHKRVLVVIGGQQNTFFSLNYVSELTEEMDRIGYSVVQVMFTSWYSAFGDTTLENDCEDFDNLLQTLEDEGAEEISVLGFNTGVQDVINYFHSGLKSDLIKRVIFQGGLRDPRLDQVGYEQRQNYKDIATSLISQGLGNCLMPPEVHPGPISAFRFVAVGGRHGVKEFFSESLSVDEMSILLGHITAPCLLILCLSDQYSPSSDSRNDLMNKLNQSLPCDSRIRWIESSCDENLNPLKGFEEELTYEISGFIQQEERKQEDMRNDRLREEAAEERRKRSVVFQAKTSKSRSGSKIEY